MENSTTYYTTSDLYLAAYLKTKGGKLSVEKKGSKAHFKFIENPDLLSNVNDYFMEDGSCEPLAYTNAIKNLKNLIFNS